MILTLITALEASEVDPVESFSYQTAQRFLQIAMRLSCLIMKRKTKTSIAKLPKVKPSEMMLTVRQGRKHQDLKHQTQLKSTKYPIPQNEAILMYLPQP